MPMARFQNNFTEVFLGWPSTKIAKMVLLCWTKWPPKLKVEKPLISISHAIDTITFTANVSLGERSRAIMALLFSF